MTLHLRPVPRLYSFQLEKLRREVVADLAAYKQAKAEPERLLQNNSEEPAASLPWWIRET